MLDLIFLVLFIYIIIRSLNGYFNDTLCNTALVIGILAGIVGIFVANELTLNLAVFVIAIAQKYAARYLAKLYNDKIAKAQQKLEDEIKSIRRQNDDDYNINEDDFDNEEVRFGKGGFTAYDEESPLPAATLDLLNRPTLKDKERPTLGNKEKNTLDKK